jgi:hypothetical protein
VIKWLFAFLLAVVIFGSAAFFGYHVIVKPELAVRAEQSGQVPDEPRIDVSLPDFQAASKLRQEGKLNEARTAFTSFLQKYPNSPNARPRKTCSATRTWTSCSRNIRRRRRRNTS